MENSESDHRIIIQDLNETQLKILSHCIEKKSGKSKCGQNVVTEISEILELDSVHQELFLYCIEEPRSDSNETFKKYLINIDKDGHFCETLGIMIILGEAFKKSKRKMSLKAGIGKIFSILYLELKDRLGPDPRTGVELIAHALDKTSNLNLTNIKDLFESSRFMQDLAAIQTIICKGVKIISSKHFFAYENSLAALTITRCMNYFSKETCRLKNDDWKLDNIEKLFLAAYWFLWNKANNGNEENPNRWDLSQIKLFLEIYLPKLLKSKLIPENTPVSQDYLKESESTLRYKLRPNYERKYSLNDLQSVKTGFKEIEKLDHAKYHCLHIEEFKYKKPPSSKICRLCFMDGFARVRAVASGAYCMSVNRYRRE